MKRFLSLVVLAVLGFTLVGCVSKTSSTIEETNNTIEVTGAFYGNVENAVASNNGSTETKVTISPRARTMSTEVSTEVEPLIVVVNLFNDAIALNGGATIKVEPTSFVCTVNGVTTYVGQSTEENRLVGIENTTLEENVDYMFVAEINDINARSYAFVIPTNEVAEEAVIEEIEFITENGDVVRVVNNNGVFEIGEEWISVDDLTAADFYTIDENDIVTFVVPSYIDMFDNVQFNGVAKEHAWDGVLMAVNGKRVYPGDQIALSDIDTHEDGIIITDENGDRVLTEIYRPDIKIAIVGTKIVKSNDDYIVEFAALLFKPLLNENDNKREKNTNCFELDCEMGTFVVMDSSDYKNSFVLVEDVVGFNTRLGDFIEYVKAHVEISPEPSSPDNNVDDVKPEDKQTTN